MAQVKIYFHCTPCLDIVRQKKAAVAKMILRERHLFEKRLSSPRPIFQKLLRGIAIVTDKNNSGFFLFP